MGQLPPARRRRDLRRAGPHGAGLLAARTRWSTAQGNFGSLDGDRAAAMRYTECRLARDLRRAARRARTSDTVDFRPNYDGTKTEPVVLPARIPNLLINGTTGIAVGMATNIPPHNLGRDLHGADRLLDDPELSSRATVSLRQGPGLPDRRADSQQPEELKEIYETGQGTSGLRATWEEGPETRGGARPSTSRAFPYTVNKAALVERIADVVLTRKLPPLARRQGRVHRRRAHRAGVEEGRRRRRW